MDINILDFVDKDAVLIPFQQKGKKNILSAILDFMVAKKKLKSEQKKIVLKALLQREEMGSTAIGGCIALPHARIDTIKNLVLCLAVSPNGIDFDSLDQEPVNIIALLISNQKEAGLHLKMLAILARMLRDKYFVQNLKSAKSQEEVIALLRKQQQALR